jgi:hypothetical protein
MQAASAPVAGDKFDLNGHLGALLYIRVHSLKSAVETSFGPADAIAADIAVLDGDHKGDTYSDTLIFPSVLVGQLKSSVGSADPVVVGRLSKGEAKPGKSAPWILETPTQADLDVAVKYEQYAAKKAAETEAPF